MAEGFLATERRVLVVAEIGNNHEGDADAARSLVRAAAEAGADAVKLQTYRTELFVRPADAERYERMLRFELAPELVAELAGLARSLGLLFLSTPLDLESAALLEPLVDAFKIASGDNDFWPLLERVADSGKPLVVSSGASDLTHMARTVAFLRDRGVAELAILHCVSAYPTPKEEVNLAALRALEGLGCTVGYSDHTLDAEASVAAVYAGARIVEKHFTLDKAFSDFRDHQLSADPAEFRELVHAVRAAERLLGRPDKALQPSEEQMCAAIRRSVAVRADLPAGHELTADDLIWLRPAGGVAPGDEASLLGRRLARPLTRGTQIDADALEAA